MDVDNGASGVGRDSDAIKSVEDGTGCPDVFLKASKDGRRVTEYIDAF
jgi:hypothetical protein